MQVGDDQAQGAALPAGQGLRVDVGPEGNVTNVVVASSQITEMTVASVEAAKKWKFKVPPRPRPGPVNITLTLSYTLQ